MDTLDDFSLFLADISNGLIVLDEQAIVSQVVSSLGSYAQQILSLTSGLAGNISSFIMSLAFMFFVLFFFYQDGPYLARLVSHAIPIRHDYMQYLQNKLSEITRNLVLGYILVAIFQGIMAYIIFLIFRVENALVFASLVVICSFIPLFGAALIWAPIGIVRIFTINVWAGLLFLIVAGVCISLTDNFVRPFFLKDRISLHPLIIFLAILGGIQVFGFNGLVMGPLIIIFFLTVLDMFLTEHGINVDKTDDTNTQTKP
jgi:predicted PurR-regulated permease PerM